MIISMIVAAAENNAIGKNNEMLWRLPNDFKYFKDKTSGHTIIMGRKTYDSMGKALPNRKNIIITRDQDLKLPDATVTHSMEEALGFGNPDEEIFIIGGAEIYKHGMPFANRIYLTRVHQHYDADAFFPDLDQETWTEVSSERHEPDEKNNVAYTFTVLERKQ
jgi:dihydrofolate reductase